MFGYMPTVYMPKVWFISLSVLAQSFQVTLVSLAPKTSTRLFGYRIPDFFDSDHSASYSD